MDRRDLMKAAAGAAAFVGGATALGLADALGGTRAESPDHTEAYRGRTITVAASGAVAIDGRPLRLMKFGEDAYLSPLCHYEMAESPLQAARRAVDELRGASLLASGAPGHEHHATAH